MNPGPAPAGLFAFRIKAMSDEQKFRMMDWLVGLATTVALLLAGWTLMTTTDHENRLGKIEDTRFTREDAGNLKAELIQEMNTPPKWVVDRLDLILEATRTNAKKIEELGDKIEEKP